MQMKAMKLFTYTAANETNIGLIEIQGKRIFRFNPVKTICSLRIIFWCYKRCGLNQC